VLSNGKGTFGDWLMPQIDKAYDRARCRRFYQAGDSMRTCGNRCWLKKGMTFELSDALLTSLKWHFMHPAFASTRC
jgi:hypothetical protein